MKKLLFLATFCALALQVLVAQEVITTDGNTTEILFRNGSNIVSQESSPQEVKGLGVRLGEDGYKSYCNAQRRYYRSRFMIGFGWGSLITGGLLYSYGSVLSRYYVDRDGSLYLGLPTFALFVGVPLLVAGNVLLPLGYITKGVAAGKISRIAEGYNAAQNKGTELSLSMSPTLLYNHGQVAPGVGLTLSF